MKNIILCTLIVLCAFSTEKKYKVEATLPEWQKHYAKLQNVKIIVNESNMEHQKVIYILQTIDSLQMLIGPQIQSQIDSTGKR